MAFVRLPVTTVLPIPLLRQAHPLCETLCTNPLHSFSLQQSFWVVRLRLKRSTRCHTLSSYFKLIATVSFCDLPKHEGEFVAIKAIYSGVDEYWALNAQKKCKTQINVELD
jgi:hypothetical protein